MRAKTLAVLSTAQARRRSQRGSAAAVSGTLAARQAREDCQCRRGLRTNQQRAGRQRAASMPTSWYPASTEPKETGNPFPFSSHEFLNKPLPKGFNKTKGLNRGISVKTSQSMPAGGASMTARHLRSLRASKGASMPARALRARSGQQGRPDEAGSIAARALQRGGANSTLPESEQRREGERNESVTQEQRERAPCLRSDGTEGPRESAGARSPAGADCLRRPSAAWLKCRLPKKADCPRESAEADRETALTERRGGQ